MALPMRVVEESAIAAVTSSPRRLRRLPARGIADRKRQDEDDDGDPDQRRDQKLPRHLSLARRGSPSLQQQVPCARNESDPEQQRDEGRQPLSHQLGNPFEILHRAGSLAELEGFGKREAAYMRSLTVVRGELSLPPLFQRSSVGRAGDC